MQDRGMLSCTAQGAECLGACGRVKDLAYSGRPVWAPRPSVAKHRGVASVLPLPELLQPQHLWLSILGPGVILERGQQLLSPGLRRSFQPHSAQLCQGEAPGLQTPSSRSQPFQQPGVLLTSSSPQCPAARGRQGWLLRVEVSLLRPAAPGNAVLQGLSPSS